MDRLSRQTSYIEAAHSLTHEFRLNVCTFAVRVRLLFLNVNAFVLCVFNFSVAKYTRHRQFRSIGVVKTAVLLLLFFAQTNIEKGKKSDSFYSYSLTSVCVYVAFWCRQMWNILSAHTFICSTANMPPHSSVFKQKRPKVLITCDIVKREWR